MDIGKLLKPRIVLHELTPEAFLDPAILSSAREFARASFWRMTEQQVADEIVAGRFRCFAIFDEAHAQVHALVLMSRFESPRGPVAEALIVAVQTPEPPPPGSWRAAGAALARAAMDANCIQLAFSTGRQIGDALGLKPACEQYLIPLVDAPPEARNH